MTTLQQPIHNLNAQPSLQPTTSNAQQYQRIYQYVLELCKPDKRESALLELSKRREEVPELAPLLWHSYGAMASLLQEIVAIYPLLSPPRLTPMISNRCCNALALLQVRIIHIMCSATPYTVLILTTVLCFVVQCVASHADTRSAFLHSHLGLFLYPFLNTTAALRQYEYLRLTSLGVIGALVKMDDNEVIAFLLQTEIIPLALRIMDNGSELSKTVATFIIQKILLDDMGLNYICATYERFSTVASVLSKMVTGLVERPSVRLLKHIVRCYLRLSDNARARDALRTCLPMAIRDNSFGDILKDDLTIKRWVTQLKLNIGDETA